MPMGNPGVFGGANGRDLQTSHGDALRRSPRVNAFTRTGQHPNSLADSFERQEADEQLEGLIPPLSDLTSLSCCSSHRRAHIPFLG